MNAAVNTTRKPDAGPAWFVPALLAVLVPLAWVAAFLVVPSGDTFVDEQDHLAQIRRFLGGGFSTIDTLPMLPGYHAIIAVLAGLTGMETLQQLRFVSACVSLTALPLSWLFLRDEPPATAAAKCLQLLACPLFFAYYFLLYTDVTALVLVLGGLLLSRRGHHHGAALVLGAAVLVRQTHIVWLGLGWIAALADHGVWQAVRDSARGRGAALAARALRGLGATWSYALVAALFAAFVAVNGGVAVGDHGVHTLNGLYPGQIFWLLLAVFFLVLPLHVINLGAIAARLRAHPMLATLPLGAAVLFLATFSLTHPYNDPQFNFFLRNALLNRVDQDWWLRLLVLVPMLWALLSLWVTPLKTTLYYALYPLAILALLPVELIEQRYYLVPLVLLTLFRQPMRARWEWLLVAAYVPLSAYLGWGIATRRFFL